MIEYGVFNSHSGFQLPWKINCDSLTDDDLASLARIVAGKFRFSKVIGIPRGGIRFSRALRPYCKSGAQTLIVDDVMTTGQSMEEMRENFSGEFLAPVGVVIFARGPVPDWISPIFVVKSWTQWP